MADFRIIPLGIGAAFTRKYYTTCVAVGVGDFWILVDCPHPIRRIVHEGMLAAGVPLDLEQLGGVALTHLHADHCSGLEDFGFYWYYIRNERAPLLAHPSVTEKLWSGTLVGGMGESREGPDRQLVTRGFDDFFDLKSLNETQSVTFGPFTIECRMTLHSIPTTAFRISAAGRVFGFSSDTAWDPSLIDWLAPADLIVHEVTSLPASELHTPYHYLAALPEPLRRKMRLTHYPDDFDLEPRSIELLRQGVSYIV